MKKPHFFVLFKVLLGKKKLIVLISNCQNTFRKILILFVRTIKENRLRFSKNYLKYFSKDTSTGFKEKHTKNSLL